MSVYKLIKPDVTDVWSSVRKQAKNSWWFWGFVIASVSEAYILGNYWLFLLIMFFIMSATNKARDSFWKQIAENNGWQYKGELDVFSEKGIMFQQGKGRRIYHLIVGDIANQPFRMLNYQFSIGEKEDEKTYWYTVFAFKFKGSFPHIYLNNKKNSYNVRVGESIPLPLELEKKFSLSAPRKYEMEALEIFTPDLLAKLADSNLDHDVEFVDQEMILFHEGTIDSFDKLAEEFNEVMALTDLFGEKLNKFKFEQVGDMSSQLTG